MDLSIKLSEESGERLIQAAASTSRTPTDYASELVERALRSEGNGASSEERSKKLSQALARRLKEAEELAPTLTGPVANDLRGGWDELMQEEAKKQGLRL
jgi:hypothetical protein